MSKILTTVLVLIAVSIGYDVIGYYSSMKDDNVIGYIKMVKVAKKVQSIPTDEWKPDGFRYKAELDDIEVVLGFGRVELDGKEISMPIVTYTILLHPLRSRLEEKFKVIDHKKAEVADKFLQGKEK